MRNKRKNNLKIKVKKKFHNHKLKKWKNRLKELKKWVNKKKKYNKKLNNSRKQIKIRRKIKTIRWKMSNLNNNK